MPRARNIKYNFFVNDELGELDPLARLLFIGTWTIADYKGEFEWRPKKIKTLLLPYDDCDIEELMINLDKSGFVMFYSDGIKIYVKVTHFLEHQHPHPNETKKGSDIPEFTQEMRQVIDLDRLIINHDKSRLNQDESLTDPSDSCTLIPDVLNLDTPITETPIPGKSRESKKTTYSESFDEFWFAYPGHRRGNKKRAYIEWKKIEKEEYPLITENVRQRCESDHDWIKDNGKFICHAERFLSGVRWQNPFELVGQQIDSASQAWEKVVKQLRNPEQAVLDEPTKVAVKAIGGLRALSRMPEISLNYRKKDFLEAYRQ
ncbi:hypothetical protein KAR91_54420 [Candidatus Pacearchaeota archaeon]|nr:hypothetical protein [Candidatus Pacearchaeota archaeon]